VAVFAARGDCILSGGGGRCSASDGAVRLSSWNVEQRLHSEQTVVLLLLNTGVASVVPGWANSADTELSTPADELMAKSPSCDLRGLILLSYSHVAVINHVNGDRSACGT
jgi:hypothetical protein